MRSGSACARQQVRRDALVQQLGDRPRYRRARRLEDQVVGKGAVTDDLCGLEFAPGLGDVQRVRFEHGGGEFGA